MLEENYLKTEKKKKKKKKKGYQDNDKQPRCFITNLQEEKKSQTQVVCKSSGYSPFYIQIFWGMSQYKGKT